MGVQSILLPGELAQSSGRERSCCGVLVALVLLKHPQRPVAWQPGKPLSQNPRTKSINQTTAVDRSFVYRRFIRWNPRWVHTKSIDISQDGAVNTTWMDLCVDQNFS